MFPIMRERVHCFLDVLGAKAEQGEVEMFK